MFTILHGDNILASRKALQSIKKMSSDKEVLVLDGKRVSLAELKQALEAKSLFGQEKLVVVENLISENRKQKTENRIFEYLKRLPSFTNLVLWERKKIDGRALSQFKNARIQLFKTPAIIFKFLESIRPGNTKAMLTLLESCLKKEPIELVFYMVVRQFRLLLLVKDLGEEGVPQLANWQYRRLTNQAGYFTIEKLLKIYKKFLKIDFEQKTGQAAFDLKKTLELLLVGI